MLHGPWSTPTKASHLDPQEFRCGDRKEARVVGQSNHSYI